MSRPVTTCAFVLVAASGCASQVGDPKQGEADAGDDLFSDDSEPADAAPDARPPCVEGDERVEDPDDGSCYFLVLAPATWAAARDACAALDAHLATSASLAENQLFSSIAPSVAGSGLEDVWIGATDVVLEGSFVWDDGEPMPFTNWRSGEPNNGGTSGEDCAIIEGDTGGLWDDRDCVVPVPYMCERD